MTTYDLPLIDGYQISSVLGEGGVAVVYRAEVVGEAPPKTVALKVLKPEALAQKNIVASFQYEARVLSRLDHPGIMRVFDSGSSLGLIYVAVELVDGQPFDEYLLGKGKLTQSESVGFAVQIVEALQHLHQQGYVHRDMKPGNLMLEGGSRLVLMDFGTAVKADTKIDYEAGLYGTVPFLSPEQIEQRPRIDGRADIYATGILLYRMMAGHRPFQGLREDMLDAHLHVDPKALWGSVRISPEFDALILKCLAKSPDERFASAEELLGELRVIAEAGEPPKRGLGARLLGRKG